MLRTHTLTFFISESHILAMPGANFRDKMYGRIHREAKFGTGVAGMVCNGKGVRA